MGNRPEPDLNPGAQPSPAEPGEAQVKMAEPKPTHGTMSIM